MVAIYGTTHASPGGEDYEKVRKLGHLLAENGYGVVTGGYYGLMEAAPKGAKELNNSYTEGVTVDFGIPGYKPNPFLDSISNCKDFYERLETFREKAAFQVAAPGGPGTLMEIFDMMTHILFNKASNNQKQVILFGKEYWEGLYKWLMEHPLAKHYMTPNQMSTIKLVDKPEEVLEEIKKGIDAKPIDLGKLFEKETASKQEVI